MVKPFITIACIFLWAGCVIAISFMEAWMKFRAPGVSLPIGLGIGRLVFTALNRMEWLFAIAILVSYRLTVHRNRNYFLLWFAVPFGILLLQTFWLLPALDARAAFIINGGEALPSPLHTIFSIVEAIKVIALLIIGWKYYRLAVRR